MVVGLITDQWPSGYDKYWTTFLGQETAFLNGAERIAKMMNFLFSIVNLVRIAEDTVKRSSS